MHDLAVKSGSITRKRFFEIGNKGRAALGAPHSIDHDVKGIPGEGCRNRHPPTTSTDGTAACDRASAAITPDLANAATGRAATATSAPTGANHRPSPPVTSARLPVRSNRAALNAPPHT